MDLIKREKSIYCFFAYYVSKIHDMHNEAERKAIFAQTKSFSSILCLSVNLFNFSYASLQSSYRQYCKIFGIGIIDGLIPINWFGLNGEIPKNIEGYLYDLEKKILIQEMWEDSEGFDLLTGAKNYQGQAILKRLKHHTD